MVVFKGMTLLIPEPGGDHKNGPVPGPSQAEEKRQDQGDCLLGALSQPRHLGVSLGWHWQPLKLTKTCPSGWGGSEAGTHLRLVGIEEQDSGKVLAGPEDILQQPAALSPVQVVLGLLWVVLDGG